jgi:hypothetical protein
MLLGKLKAGALVAGVMDTGLREGAFVGFKEGGWVKGRVGGRTGAAATATGALVRGTSTVGARALFGHPPQRHWRCCT